MLTVTRRSAALLKCTSACKSTFKLVSIGENMSVATSLNSPFGPVYRLKYDGFTCALGFFFDGDGGGVSPPIAASSQEAKCGASPR